METKTRLALDCAAEGLSLVLQVNDNKEHIQSHPGTRTSDLLPTALQTLFAESASTPANLQEIRLTVGPGSFTGIRLGLATAQALKLLNPALNILGFSSLQALALQIVQENAPQEAFTILLDAAGGQVYTQTFSPTGEPTTEAACIPTTEHQTSNTGTTFAPISLMLPTQPLPPLKASTLFSLPESLALPPYPVYLKTLTYKKVAE
jgi:tRNA threonylcarbamoyl adenosine modification protein YeaZ